MMVFRRHLRGKIGPINRGFCKMNSFARTLENSHGKHLSTLLGMYADSKCQSNIVVQNLMEFQSLHYRVVNVQTPVCFVGRLSMPHSNHYKCARPSKLSETRLMGFLDDLALICGLNQPAIFAADLSRN